MTYFKTGGSRSTMNITIGEIVEHVTVSATKKLLKKLGKYALAFMIFEAVVGVYIGVTYSEKVLAYVELLHYQG